MGKNTSNPAGGGNISWSGGNEIDINISGFGDFTQTQIFAHEFTHIGQYLRGEISLNSSGGGGMLYDQQDEMQAFNRQDLFVPEVERLGGEIDDFVRKRYKGIPRGPITYQTLPESEKRRLQFLVKSGIEKATGW
jgi:hypothetical protein